PAVTLDGRLRAREDGVEIDLLGALERSSACLLPRPRGDRLARARQLTRRDAAIRVWDSPATEGNHLVGIAVDLDDGHRPFRRAASRILPRRAGHARDGRDPLG